MKKVHLLFLLPILILIELLAFSGIAHLLSEPSNAAVFAGIVSVCAVLYVNYVVVKYFFIPKK